MADNLTGLNSSTKVGEGNANIIQWGNLDRTVNQLYQEQKQKEARGYNEYLAGEAALQKEFGNVRSADVPDVVNLYNARKKTKQQLLFDDKIKKDAVAYAKKQQELQLQDAELRQLIAGSQELKEIDKGINSRKASHADDFDDDLIKEHSNDLGLPLRERIKKGRVDVTPYLYSGADMNKLSAISKQAMGESKTVPFGQPIVADEGYKLEQKFITRKNNPLQYAQSMYKGMQTPNMAKGARFLLNQTTPQKVAQITQQFESIPDAEFEQKWGIKKKDLTSGVLPDDKAGQYVLLDAMQYAVNNMPQESKSDFRPNEAFKTQQNIDEWNRRNGITNTQSLNKIYANKSGQTPSPTEGGNLLDGIGSVQPVIIKGGRIEGGLVSDDNGNPLTGTLKGLQGKYLPAQLFAVLKSSGNKIYADDKFDVILKDGRIQGLKTESGIIDRQAVENAQKKWNTESAKAPQPNFGAKSNPPTGTGKKPLTLAEKMKAAKK